MAEAQLPDVDRFVGALLGGAVGDALGRPYEGSHRRSLDPPVPLRYGGHHPGSITDDTEQTILAAESLLDVGYLDPEDIARRLALWLPHGTGKGTATVHAVERLGQGVPWYLAGEDSAGNGAAMRAAPVGLRWLGDSRHLRRDATLLSLPTHRHPTGVAGAVAFATAVAYLVQSDARQLDALSLAEAMARAVSGLEPEALAERRDPSSRTTLAGRLLEVPALLDLGDDGVLLHRLWSGAFVIESLPAALYCFLRHSQDFEQGVGLAIAAGHDTDTVASFVGAMFGALHGASALPAHLVAGLEVREQIEELGHRLFVTRCGK